MYEDIMLCICYGWRLLVPERTDIWLGDYLTGLVSRNYDPCFTAPPHTVVVTTTIFASLLMARPNKRSFQKEQLKEARRSKKQRGEEEALLAAIEALGVPAEGDSDRYQVQDSTNESSDESSEEECEITDGEDTDIFDGKLIQLAAIPAFSELSLIMFPGDVFQQILAEA